MGIGIKLKRLREEDFIWVIYFFIVMGAIISNYYEKQFLYTNDYTKQKKFKLINITIFWVAFFIYLYFVLINFEDIKNLRKEASKKEVLTSQASLIAALLFLVGGIIQIFVGIFQDTPDEEIGLA